MSRIEDRLVVSDQLEIFRKRFVLLYNCFHDAPIGSRNGHRYITNSLTDHSPLTNPNLIREAVSIISYVRNYDDVDAIVGEEDRGSHMLGAYSLFLNKSLSIAHREPSGAKGEIGKIFKMAYNGEMEIHMVPPSPGTKVIIVEDMIDTGGTINAIYELLQENGVKVVDIVALTVRMENNGLVNIKKKTGIDTKAIIKLDASGDTCKVIGADFFHLWK